MRSAPIRSLLLQLVTSVLSVVSLVRTDHTRLRSCVKSALRCEERTLNID